MPAVSGPQYRYMQMIKHNPEKARKKGPSPEVAAEFIKKTSKEKRKLFSRKSD